MILGVFFTRGVSLRTWHVSGLLAREQRIYEELLLRRVCRRVLWFTYGAGDDALAKTLREEGKLCAGIVVVPLPAFWPGGSLAATVYSFLMPFVRAQEIRRCDVLKTNQVDGGWAAILASWISGRPVLARCGYLLTLFVKRGERRMPRWFSRWAEGFLFTQADRVFVPNREAWREALSRYRLPALKMTMVPNYVDIAVFAAPPDLPRGNRMLFVGRLHRQKNLVALVEAAARTGIPLDIAGGGLLRGDLEALAAARGAQVNFLGVVPHGDVPRLMAGAGYFVLPSFYEGLPKVLLEAMAAGCVCVAADIPGINDIIRDGENGFLIRGGTADAVAEALGRAAAADHRAVGAAAVATVRGRYSVAAVADAEERVLRELMNDRRGT